MIEWIVRRMSEKLKYLSEEHKYVRENCECVGEYEWGTFERKKTWKNRCSEKNEIQKVLF